MARSPDTENLNRYRWLIQKIEQLFESNSLTLTHMRSFMDLFNNIINTDIEIMEKNETIRMNAYRIKEKFLYRTEDIRKKKEQLMYACEGLHDKEDILNFIALDFKNYLTSIKLINEEYESVKKVEVNTPIKIDSIYSF